MRKPSFRLLFLMAEIKKPRKAWALQGVFYKYLRNLRNLRAITRTPASS